MEGSADAEIPIVTTHQFNVYYRDLKKQQNKRYRYRRSVEKSKFSFRSNETRDTNFQVDDNEIIVGNDLPRDDLSLQFVSNDDTNSHFQGDDVDTNMDDFSDDDEEPQLNPEPNSNGSYDELVLYRDLRELEEETFLQEIIEFIHDANLNKTDTNSLLNLLRRSKSSYDIPSTPNQLLQKLNITFHYEAFIYCSTCFSLMKNFHDRCRFCSNVNRKTNSELIVFSISNELERVVKSNFDLIQWYRFPENQIASDIVQGEIYQGRRSDVPSLSIMITTDGKPLIRSKTSTSSVWPVLANLVEIPPSIRERFNNIMLLGLWHSPISPPADLLLNKIVDSIRMLTIAGIDIFINGKFHHFRVHVQLFSGDLPARAKCNMLISHNGFFACSRCLMEGRRCPSPCKRHTLYRWIDYRNIRPPLRTPEHIYECTLRSVDHTPHSFGVLGLSPLSSILSIPTQSTFDYFHLALEIHLRTLLGQWNLMLKDYRGAIQYIDGFLMNIDYPHTFNRTPRNFANYNKWKASELRTFLLYVSFPLLIKLRLTMPQCFPEIYVYHYSLFFIYIRTLRYFFRRNEIYAMPTFIDEYLEMFASLYGECKELYSTHALCHLYDQVKEHGGLAFHSLFSTESALNHIGKMSHGSVSLGQQIAYWWCIFSEIKSRKMSHSPNMFIQQELIVDAYCDNLFIETYHQEFSLVYYETFGTLPSATIKFYSRYKTGLLVYHSLSYIRRNTTASYNVSVELNDSNQNLSSAFGQILFFFYVDKKPYFLFKQLTNSKNRLSTLLHSSGNNSQWSTWIDKYYPIVDHSKASIFIYPCSSIATKCIFFPLDKNYSICTRVELEIEHD